MIIFQATVISICILIILWAVKIGIKQDYRSEPTNKILIGKSPTKNIGYFDAESYKKMVDDLNEDIASYNFGLPTTKSCLKPPRMKKPKSIHPPKRHIYKCRRLN